MPRPSKRDTNKCKYILGVKKYAFAILSQKLFIKYLFAIFYTFFKI